jgi:hypothetical protein
MALPKASPFTCASPLMIAWSYARPASFALPDTEAWSNTLPCTVAFPEMIASPYTSPRTWAWSWKNKRKPKAEIQACSPDDYLYMALAEIRILAPHGKAFALLQLFRKNHAGGPFMIQPEKMAQQVYSGTTWTIKNYREARDVLLREGFIAIHERHPRSRIKATKYALAVRPLTDADRRLSLDVLKHIGSAMKTKAAPAQSKKGASAGGASSPDALKSMKSARPGASVRL